MMLNRTQRYRNGECLEVWAELTTSECLTHGEAEGVIDEIMARIRSNVEKIASRLRELGYKFGRPDGPYKFRADGDYGELDQAEREWGRFPKLVRRFYEAFEFIDFSQHDDQIDQGSLRGLGYYPQLYFLSLNECAGSRQEMFRQVERDNEFMSRLMLERGEPWTPDVVENFLPLGPVASNNSLIGFTLPSTGIDAVCYDDGGGPVMFLEHLRRIFDCGGFPQLKKYIRNDGLRNALGMPDPQSILERLAHDLEPI